MTMHNNGFSKLTEELGELLQIIGKYQAYPEQDHPDGKGNTRERLEEEIADVEASLMFLRKKLKLNISKIFDRMSDKIILYVEWDKQE